MLAILALALLPGFAAPFTAATLQDSRLLYEPTAVLVIALAVALARIRTQRKRTATVLAVGLALVFGGIAWRNAAPWLRAGRVSAGIHAGLVAWQSEDFATGRWVVDLPVVLDGAYLFLGDAEPFLDPRLDPTKTARLVGVRETRFAKVLHEAERREQALASWDVWRPSWIDGRLHRERPETWLLDSRTRQRLGIHIARFGRRELLPGETLPLEVIADDSDRRPQLELSGPAGDLECTPMPTGSPLDSGAVRWPFRVPESAPPGSYDGLLQSDGMEPVMLEPVAVVR